MARGNQKQSKISIATQAFGVDTLGMENKTLKNPKAVLTAALDIAKVAHEGQFRNDKVTPYIKHPLEVAAKLPDWKAKAVALLHDTIEDNPNVTPATLKAAGIPDDVVEAVKAMTHGKATKEEMDYWKKNPEEGRAHYLNYIKTQVAPNDLARRVKMADIETNMADKPTKNQVLKYQPAYEYLKNYKA